MPSTAARRSPGSDARFLWPPIWGRSLLMTGEIAPARLLETLGEVYGGWGAARGEGGSVAGCRWQASPGCGGRRAGPLRESAHGAPDSPPPGEMPIAMGIS